MDCLIRQKEAHRFAQTHGQLWGCVAYVRPLENRSPGDKKVALVNRGLGAWAGAPDTLGTEKAAAGCYVLMGLRPGTPHMYSSSTTMEDCSM